MRYLIITLSLILNIHLGFTQSKDCQEQYIVRLSDESAIEFINRIKTDSIQLAHALIETNVWDPIYKSIIALYCYDDPGDNYTGCKEIFGQIFMQIDNMKYRLLKFGQITEDSGYPEILAISFANADNDREKELIVLSRYRVYNVDESGYLYKTFIYDNPDNKNELVLIDHLSKDFFGCDCFSRDGSDTNTKAMFKTIKSIKRKLKELGY